MSIPTTCHGNKKRKSANTDSQRDHLPHLISRVLLPINQEFCKEFCSQSLQNVCSLYGVPSEHPTVLAIEECLASDMSSTETLSFFFVLLNIDMTVKERMMQSETEAQQQKIANFFMNLRKHLVCTYMSQQESTPSSFVHACADAWSFA